MIDFDNMTIAQLKQHAADNAIELDKSLIRKQDIINAIRAATPPTSDETKTGDVHETEQKTDEATENTPPADETKKDGDAGAEQNEDDPPPGDTVLTFTLDRVLRVNKPFMKGDDVKAIQNALIKKGLHVGGEGANGKYNASTAIAVRHFQSQNGLPVSGRVEKKTAAALGAEWTGR